MLGKVSNQTLARLLALIIFLGGITTSIAFAQVSKQRYSREIQRVFAAESDSMRAAVKKQIDLFFSVLESLGSLHELSDQISAEDFEEFARKGMRFQEELLGAYGFIQRVPDDLRSALEQDPNKPLRIIAPDESGNLSASAPRPEYFPLMYQKPEGALSFPLGTDMAQLPGIADVFARMIERRGPGITPALRLQRNDDEAGYIVLAPLFQSNADAAEPYFSGCMISILWPREILDRALADTPVRDVLVRFYDDSATPPQAAPDAEGNDLTIREAIGVADRTWIFETTASPEYLQSRQTILPGFILLSGSVITLLITATIGLIAGRTRQIEAVVNQRTRELKDSMQERMRLESEILEISDREKRQIGQDLHDSLGQKLTGAIFLSRALTEHAQGTDETTRTQAARINETLKEAVGQVRRMARGLSPIELGQDGLAGALQRLAAEVSDIYGISCLFHQVAPIALPAGKNASHIYAITLEAVTNAVKHGGANEIVIELSAKESRHQLVIEDNGKGFDPASAQHGGLGLRIMQYRASMIDGTVEVRNRPEGGMEVVCVF